MGNVETPLRSGTDGQVVHPWQSATRKEGLMPQRDRKTQEAKASRRKAEGMHNLLDRAVQAEIPASKEGRRGSGESPKERRKER
jgi:hypothetical protein